jgi:hypothetical protein
VRATKKGQRNKNNGDVIFIIVASGCGQQFFCYFRFLTTNYLCIIFLECLAQTVNSLSNLMRGLA